MEQNTDNGYRYTNNIDALGLLEMIDMSTFCMSHSVNVFICFSPQLSKWFYMKHLRDPKIIEATTAMATQTTSDVDTWAPWLGEGLGKASKHILWLGNHLWLQDPQMLHAHVRPYNLSFPSADPHDKPSTLYADWGFGTLLGCFPK